jgi:hypothetical protein
MRGLPEFVDERFLAHRLRATSLAGICGAIVALAWFVYHLLTAGQWRWDLLSVGLTMAAVKLALMIWYRLTE